MCGARAACRFWPRLDKVAARAHRENRNRTIRVHRAAFAAEDGVLPFGFDNTTANAEGSSLMLSKRTRGAARGVPGYGHRLRGPG